MTALFHARQRVEEFAAAVDAPHRQVSEELRPLVAVTQALRAHAEADLAAMPREDFAAELRARLMSEAAEVLTPGSPLVLPTRPRGRRERHLVAAASAVVLLGGSAGMAAAAQDALPGDALYPVKRGIERAEAGLSVSSSGKGRDLLHQADGRLTEVQDLLADGSVARSSRVSQALQDFTAQAEQGSGLLMDAYRTDRDPSSIVTVREFSAQGITDPPGDRTHRPAGGPGASSPRRPSPCARSTSAPPGCARAAPPTCRRWRCRGSSWSPPRPTAPSRPSTRAGSTTATPSWCPRTWSARPATTSPAS